MTDKPASERPFIFLCSLDKKSYFDAEFAALLGTLARQAQVIRATKADSALNFLKTQSPSAVLVTDPAIAWSACGGVRDAVIAYARAGGVVILACHFSSFVGPQNLDKFLQCHWKLPWRSGVYERTTLALQPSVAASFHRPLPPLYSQKALFLDQVPPEACLYLTNADSRLEADILGPAPIKHPDQTPVVWAKVGSGRLGYLGDVYSEAVFQSVLLAMCGL